MSTAKRFADAGFALTFALLAFVNAAFAADNGLITGTISLPRLRPAVGDHPVARPAASAAGELCKKKIRRGARRRPANG